MSAKLAAITARKPYSCSAHTACSRDEPHPKFTTARNTLAPAATRPVAQIVEEAGADPRPLHPLEELFRDDLVGIDVDAGQRRDPTRVSHEWRAHDHSRTSTSRPAIAAAAAIAGLIKWVLPPRPCRPSKLRFDVDRKSTRLNPSHIPLS